LVCSTKAKDPSIRQISTCSQKGDNIAVIVRVRVSQGMDKTWKRHGQEKTRHIQDKASHILGTLMFMAVRVRVSVRVSQDMDNTYTKTSTRHRQDNASHMYIHI
jgi:hypothetical protein